MHLTSSAPLAAIWPGSLRQWIIVLNVVALVAIGAYLVYSAFSRRERQQEKPAPNEQKFLPDDELEGRRLERVLGWALLFVSAFAVVLLVYMLREPTRQGEAEEYFADGSVERGRTLYANASSEYYDSVLSLQCANCHGAEGGGGAASTVVDPDGPGGQPPEQVTWRAPALNTVLLRFSEEEVNRIITYGRPGTPMQAFGVAGGGAENEQTIEDLVAFLRSIQLSPEEAREQARLELEGDPSAEEGTALRAGARGAAEVQLADAQRALDDALVALDEAEAALAEALGRPGDTPADALDDACTDLEEEVRAADTVTEEQRTAGEACRTFRSAAAAAAEAEEAYEWAQRWAEFREGVSDGQLLFELHCARCHTQGWSTFDPTRPGGTDRLGLPGGGGGAGGGIGFNLRDGAQQRRFGEGESGLAAQIEFIKNGSDENQPYGRGGIGSGRMPGFGQMLTDEMIEEIVRYEREQLDATTYDVDGGDE
ncbi:MAG: hypothetical protein KatS3mg009_0240 [Acidimicrobiia bacterium]|nr:MAG: hypothetical protein KatS3mg009_0240 [Acidimicrobiia bacterium]